MADFDLVVLGAGPGGYVAAIRASQLGLKVAVVEKKYWGGVCLNVGCIPSKALIKNAELAHLLTHDKKKFGIEGDATMSYGPTHARSRQVSAGIVKGVHFLMKKNKITEIDGWGTITSANTVDGALNDGETKTVSFDKLIIAAGAIMFWQRDIVAKAQFERPALGDANDVWDAIMGTLRRWSLKLTASTQRGSLSINLAVIFTVLAVVPLAALILGDSNNIRMTVWDNVWQGLTVTLMAGLAFFATLQHNRLSGVIMVGLTGYFMALLFVLHGAPDIALTQILVETVALVVVVWTTRVSW